MKNTAYKIIIWWAVISYGLWVGGTLFNILVIVPLWSHQPPESVKFFFGQTNYSTTILNFFGPPWMVVRVVPVLLGTLLSWREKSQRRLMIASSISLLVIVAYTLLYIYPINSILINQAGGSSSATEIQTMVDKWIFADRLRFFIGTFGYICLLRNFQLVAHKNIA